MFFAFSIFVLLLPLLFFKYSIYLSDLPLWLKGFMPFGISFYTFRLITYLADCRKGEKAEENFFHFAMYAFAFPVLSQGPILRYKEMREEIEDREWDFDKLSRSLYRFSFGLWKKLLLADSMGKLSNSFLPLELAKGLSGSGYTLPSFMSVFLSSLSFMLQIYLDFSAYTDMAIGIGAMVGFTIPENFHYPYEAKSVRDFWRRWHISLSLFFRDYIYIPLGGNRLSFPRRVLNLFLIWILTGMWHGASFNFILWGLYFFVLIVLELMGRKALHRLETIRPEWKEKMTSSRLKVLKEPVLHIYTLFAVYLSWILFRFSDFQSLKNILWLHTLPKSLALVDGKTLLIAKSNIFLLLVAILFSGNLLSSLEEEWQKLLFRGKSRLARKKRASLGFYGMEDSDGKGDPCPEETSGETEVQKEEAISLAEEVEAELSQENQEDLLRHEKILRRIQRRTKLNIFFLDHAEQLYFWGKLLAAIAFLLLSFALMAGQSYMPFLYNQF